MQLTCLISTNELCHCVECDIRTVFDLSDVRIIAFAHAVELQMMFWLVHGLDVSSDVGPELVIGLHGVRRDLLLVPLPIMFSHNN